MGGWTVPIPGIGQAASFAHLLQAVKAKQGNAYVGDDKIAFMICERDPSFCHSYVGTNQPRVANAPVQARQGGCGSCAARAAAKAARNNAGGRLR